MAHDWVSWRLGSLELLAGVALFLALGALARRGRGTVAGDAALPGTQRVELRIDEVGGTRTVRSPLPIIIGRASAANLRLADPQVSRLHARIDALNGEISVVDLESRNGTRVNARPIDGSVALSPGDEIRIGTARIVFGGVVPWK